MIADVILGKKNINFFINFGKILGKNVTKILGIIFIHFFLERRFFIVSEPKNRQKNYKQMLYTTHIIIYKIQK